MFVKLLFCGGSLKICLDRDLPCSPNPTKPNVTKVALSESDQQLFRWCDNHSIAFSVMELCVYSNDKETLVLKCKMGK